MMDSNDDWRLYWKDKLENPIPARQCSKCHRHKISYDDLMDLPAITRFMCPTCKCPVWAGSHRIIKKGEIPMQIPEWLIIIQSVQRELGERSRNGRFKWCTDLADELEPVVDDLIHLMGETRTYLEALQTISGEDQKELNDDLPF